MKKVVLNASGGGSDSGVKANGLTEKDVTLEITNILKNILESKGVEVLLLRDSDTTISYDDRIKKLKEKYPDPRDVIVLSNTLNSGGGSGIEVIYALNNNDKLASTIAKNLDYFNNTKYYQLRYPSDTTKDYYYITRNTPGYETVIVRYGYADNSNDAQIIKNNLEEIASSVADSLFDYIGVLGSDYYIVQAGDTLYALAKKFNTTVDEIKKLNGLTSNNLSVNQSLKIPSPSTSSSESNKESTNTGKVTYKVKSGDTLYAIAKKYNITVDKLKKANNLSGTLLSINQVLVIPSKYKTITVVKGDTLYQLARKYNTTVDEIKRINNLKSNLLSIGQVLYIP